MGVKPQLNFPLVLTELQSHIQKMKFVCILFAIVASVAAQPTYLREAGQHSSFATNFGYQIPFSNIPEVGLGVDSFPVPFPTIAQRFITVPLPALEYPQPRLFRTRY